jgi:hypothetical protein
MHYRFDHEFDCDPKTYWEIFWSQEYNDDLYKQLDIPKREVIELKDDGKVVRRVWKLTPKTDVPSILRSIIKDQSYTETDHFNREKSVMEVVIEPALMTSKFDMRATYAVNPAGEGKCRRIFEGDVKVSIMMLGGQIEKFTVEQMRKSYEIATRVTRSWIEKRKAG